MKIAIIGTGNMGTAIARGLVKGSLFKPSDITCTAKSEKTLDKIKAINSGFIVSTDNMEAARHADIIIIAVKPRYVEQIITEIKPVLDYEKQMLVSVAAGISTDSLNSFLGRSNNSANSVGLPLFRVMPNTAIEVLSSMTLVSASDASDEQTNLILRIFNELGKAILIEERLMGAGTALASCGLAFALRYIRASMEGGIELGFTPENAQELIVYTMKGAADLLLENKSNPEVEIDKITSPGGITIKGLNEMELSGFTSSVIQGLKACR